MTGKNLENKISELLCLAEELKSIGHKDQGCELEIIAQEMQDMVDDENG